MAQKPRPQTRRVAKERRADGTLVLRVEARTFVDLDEAALALALVHEGPTVVHFGHTIVQRNLVEAARQRVLERLDLRHRADPALVATYRSKLLEIGAFPDPDDPDAVARWDPSQARRGHRVARYRRPDGTWIMRVDAPTFFDLEEAALALALVYQDQSLRFGQNAIETGFVDAARQRVLDHARTRPPNPDAVAHYRQVLIDSEVFPAQDPR